MTDIMKEHGTSGNSAKESVLKVVLKNGGLEASDIVSPVADGVGVRAR